MATVNGYTKERMDEIVDATIVSGAIDGTGHLILTTHDGTEIDAGAVLGSVPSATTSVQGIVELATDAEAITGTDTVRAVTPHALAAAVPAATATAQGKVELATPTEATTGTDTSRAVTPEGLKAAIDAAMQLIFPVGSIYTSYSVSTNPNTLLGFGTWSAISGRILIGQDGSTYTAGGTGGSATHTIASGNLPTHTHGVSISSSGASADHTHAMQRDLDGSSGSARWTFHTTGGAGGGSTQTGGASADHFHNVIGNTDNGGFANSSINHMNPYVGVYLWRRTA
jgi:microcystin-dependent protein